MRKIFILTKREFITSVRTKSFLIGLIIAPILMGGSIVVIKITEDKIDIKDKNFAVVDYTGRLANDLVETAIERNEKHLFDSETGEQIWPAYYFKKIEPRLDSIQIQKQRLELSQKVLNKELHAFIEIGHDVIHPGRIYENHRIAFYSENSFVDGTRNWILQTLNQQIRRQRLSDLNLEKDISHDLFYWINVDGLGLVNLNKETGNVSEARESNIIQSIMVPYILMMILFMMVMMFAVPLLSAVMEEKTERIAEVLLGTVTPFQFMMGKLLGSISVAIIGSSVYIIGGIIAATQLDYADLVPYHLLPWFFSFLILEIIMIGSIMIALGAACNNSKDAQSLQFPAIIPVLLPMFVMLPVLKDPLGLFSTVLSLIPPFTPALMIVRQATPVSIPLWQPIVGLIGVVLFTLFSVWIGGRIFRSLILMQGKPPKLSFIIRWAIKG